MIGQRLSTTVQSEQRIPAGHEIPNLRNKFDQAVGAPGQIHQTSHVERQHDARASGLDGTRGSPWQRRDLYRRLVRRRDRSRIDLSDDRLPRVANEGEKANRPQRLTYGVDQVEEDTDTAGAAVRGDPHRDLRDHILGAAERRQRIGEREDEDGQRDAQDAAAKESGDDAWRQLRAGQLHGHQHDRKNEDNKREHGRRQRRQQGACALGADDRLHAQDSVQATHERMREQHQHHHDQRRKPDGIPEEPAHVVTLQPSHDVA